MNNLLKYIALLILLTFLLNCINNEKRQISSSEKLRITGDTIIIGKWIVVKSSKLPFEHASYCYELNLNCVFEFGEFGNLNVYEELNKGRCTRKQTYKVVDTILGITESDMFFKYTIETITSDTLRLNLYETKLTLIKIENDS